MTIRPQVMVILLLLGGMGLLGLYWGVKEVPMACIVALAALSKTLVEGD